MSEHKCRFCDKEFKTHFELGGHVVSCKKNPKSSSRNKKLSMLMMKRKKYSLVCSCGKLYEIEITPRELENGDYRHYCSRSCANRRERPIEVRNKISLGVKRAGVIPVNKGKSEKKELMKKLFGTKCYFCGFKPKEKGQWTAIHRKDGKEHKLPWNLTALKTVDPKDYVRLCGDDHHHVHWAMRYMNMSWEEIESRFNFEKRHASVRQR